MLDEIFQDRTAKMGNQQRSFEEENVQRLSRRGVGESRSSRHPYGMMIQSVPRRDGVANTNAYKTARDISGVVATRVQGPELTIPLYEKGTSKTVWIRGNPAPEIHRAGTQRTFYKRGDSVTNAYYSGSRVKLQGTKYSGKLYDADGALVSSSLYLGDGDYVYKRGSSCGTLYEDGGDETVWIQGSEITEPYFDAGSRLTYIEQPEDPYAAALFLQDQNSYAGGLYYDIQLANFTTRAATLLQA